MADNIPDISPVGRRNAEWAGIFGGGTTNAAQRQRYAQAQQDHAEELLRARAAAQYDQAQTNKTAQDFYFRQQELDRKQAMDKATMDIRHQQQANRDELLPAQIESAKALAKLRDTSEALKEEKKTRDAQRADRVLNDTNSFEKKQDALLDTALPGSQAFADQTLKNIAAHPFISADLRKTWLGQAGIKNDPDQLMRDTAQFQQTHNTTLTRDSKGQWEVKLTPKVAPKATGTATDPLQQRLTHLENLRMRPEVSTDKNVRDYLDKEIKGVKDQISVRPAAPVAQPPPIGTPPPVADTTAPPAADTTSTDAPVPEDAQYAGSWAGDKLVTEGINGAQPETPPPVTPAVAPAAPTTGSPMELTSKEQFDSLPSGGEFIWNGKRGKKP